MRIFHLNCVKEQEASNSSTTANNANIYVAADNANKASNPTDELLKTEEVKEWSLLTSSQPVNISSWFKKFIGEYRDNKNNLKYLQHAICCNFVGQEWSRCIFVLDINDVTSYHPEMGRKISMDLNNFLPQLRLGLINFLQDQVNSNSIVKEINYDHINIFVEGATGT